MPPRKKAIFVNSSSTPLGELLVGVLKAGLRPRKTVTRGNWEGGLCRHLQHMIWQPSATWTFRKRGIERDGVLSFELGLHKCPRYHNGCRSQVGDQTDDGDSLRSREIEWMGLKGKLTKGSRCDYINALNVNISVKDSQHIKDGPVADKRRKNRRSSLSQE